SIQVAGWRRRHGGRSLFPREAASCLRRGRRSARLALIRYKWRDKCAIRIRQQVQEFHFGEIADQLKAREGRVVHAEAAEVREFEPHEMAQNGADDVAVRDE